MEPVIRTSDGALWIEAAVSPAAFGLLYERHADSVYNHCFRRTGSWGAAEDLTSTVFLEAWRRRREVRLVGESILPWLLAVANNAVRNHNRSVRRQGRLLLRIPGSVEDGDHSGRVDDRIDSERRMHDVLRAFNRLSNTDQDILSLCGWAELDYASVAAVLGIPVGTVRSRLSRARERLRTLSAAKHEPTEPEPVHRGAPHV